MALCRARLPTPACGDWLTWSIGDDQVLLVRGRDGAVRAFHNVCRHRGARICNAASGNGQGARLPLSRLDLRPRRPPAHGDRARVRRRQRRPGPAADRAARCRRTAVRRARRPKPPTSSGPRPRSRRRWRMQGFADAKVAHTHPLSRARPTGSSCSRTTASATTAPMRTPSTSPAPTTSPASTPSSAGGRAADRRSRRRFEAMGLGAAPPPPRP